jgi:methionyl-tRNA formyltransferase
MTKTLDRQTLIELPAIIQKSENQVLKPHTRSDPACMPDSSTHHPTCCVFMGSDPIAIPMLDYLCDHESHRIRIDTVITQPDRKTGRGQQNTIGPIKAWAIQRNIPVHQPERAGNETLLLGKTRAWELALVMAFGQILKDELLKLPRLGCYNLHASLLPKLRGASPIETAIVTGEKESGMTLMKMVRELDAGPIAASLTVPITGDESPFNLRQKLAESCIPLMASTLPAMLAGQLSLSEQDPDQATYCRILSKSDAWLDFSLPASELEPHIRGFQPWPGALMQWEGTALRIAKASIIALPAEPSTHTPQPGTLIDTSKQLIIACGQDALKIHQLQRPGGKVLDANAFLNGFPMPAGAVLSFPRRFPLTAKRYFKAPVAPHPDR